MKSLFPCSIKLLGEQLLQYLPTEQLSLFVLAKNEIGERYLRLTLQVFTLYLRLLFFFAFRMYNEEIRTYNFAVTCHDPMAAEAERIKTGTLRLSRDTRTNLCSLKLDVTKKFFPNLIPVGTGDRTGGLIPADLPDVVRYRVKLSYLLVEDVEEHEDDWETMEVNQDVENATRFGVRHDSTHAILKVVLRPAIDLRQLTIQCNRFVKFHHQVRGFVGQPFQASELQELTIEALRTHVRPIIETHVPFAVGRELRLFHTEGEGENYLEISSQEQLLDIIHSRQQLFWNLYVEVEGLTSNGLEYGGYGRFNYPL